MSVGCWDLRMDSMDATVRPMIAYKWVPNQIFESIFCWGHFQWRYQVITAVIFHTIELTLASEWSNFFASKNTDTRNELAPSSLRNATAAPCVELPGTNRNNRFQSTDTDGMKTKQHNQLELQWFNSNQWEIFELTTLGIWVCFWSEEYQGRNARRSIFSIYSCSKNNWKITLLAW